MEQRKVLLVDDEAEFVSALSERLMLRGLDARTASSGEEAFRLVENDPPQVVVLDVMMPGLGGIEVLQHLKRHHPGIQIVLLTGMTGTLESDEARRLGAFECLTKPLNIDELIKVINAAVAARDEPQP